MFLSCVAMDRRAKVILAAGLIVVVFLWWRLTGPSAPQQQGECASVESLEDGTLAIRDVVLDLDEVERYSVVLREALAKGRKGMTPYDGIRTMEDLSSLGLDDPNGVAFLVGVLESGPNWPDTGPQSATEAHVARCYSALLLGSSKDPMAVEPLIRALHRVDANESRHYVASYAASALGMLGGADATDALIEALGHERPVIRAVSADAISQIRDLRAVKPLIEALKDSTPMEDGNIHNALEQLLRLKFRHEYRDGLRNIAFEEFPELGAIPLRGHSKRLWPYWWGLEPEFSRKRFEQHYGQWRQAPGRTPPLKSAVAYYAGKVVAVGVPALPFMIDKLEDGDTEMIKLISRLTGGELEPTATRAECLQWWQTNKDKWLLPFGEPLVASPPM